MSKQKKFKIYYNNRFVGHFPGRIEEIALTKARKREEFFEGIATAPETDFIFKR